MAIDVSVDPDYCVGSGDCVRTAPKAFRINDDEGIAEVLPDVADTDTDLLVRAAEECPTNAITVAEDGDVLVEGA